VFFRRGDKLFFVYGFPKSQRVRISEQKERYYKKEAKKAFSYSDADLVAGGGCPRLVFNIG
jgi:hypothetical protein